MSVRARVGWTVVALLLSVLLTGVTSSLALAESRGNSGLPSGHGNPIAKLQQEINALTQRLAELAQLGQSVAGLQQQIDSLQKQVTTLQQQGAAIDSLQRQLTTLQQQVAAYSTLQQQINTLNSQVGSLNTQLASVNARLGTLGSSSALAVYDAHGNKIGDVVGVQDEIPWVSVTAGGHVVALRVFAEQLVGGFVWFSGANCAGTAYLSDAAMFNTADAFSFAAVREPGGVIYTADPKTTVQRVPVLSVAQHDGTCFTFSSPVTQSLVPGTAIMTLDLQFSRPYSVH
jgi:uncharacterized protein YlxW (UPF0749 family)